MTTALTDPRLNALIDPTLNAFTDPRQVALLDPDQVPGPVWQDIPNEGRKYQTLTDISLGLGVAFLVLNRMVGKSFMAYHIANVPNAVAAPFLGSASFSADRITSKYRRAWQHMVNPAFQTAFQLGTTNAMSYHDEVQYASVFSNQLFDYINETSNSVLIDAYQHELAQKWHPDIAWLRASGGYGLEQRSMAQYLKMLGNGEGNKVVPEVATKFVQRALHERAERIGANESQRAIEMGKTLVWMRQHREGRLPPNIQREWLTAEDERVCPICGPMDHVKIGMQDRFELPDGNEVWAPGVHPNCRCGVRLAYPRLLLVKREVSGEPRDNRGRWAVAEREVETEPVITAPVRITAPIMAPVEAPVSAPVSTPSMITAPVEAPITAPVTAPVRAPAVKIAPITIPAPIKAYNFERPPVDYYAFANDLEYQAGSPGAWHADRSYKPGDIIDLDRLSKPGVRGESKFSLRIRPLDSEYLLAQRAEYAYGDTDKWDLWDRTGKDAYITTSKNFYSRAEAHTKDIVQQLSSADIHRIYGLAGDVVTTSITPNSDLREILEHDISAQGTVRDAYLHYIEKNHTGLVTGSVGEEMATYQRIQEEQGLEPHTVSVLVFDKGFQGGFEGTETQDDGAITSLALAEGRYRVHRVVLRPLKVSLGGGDVPSNVENISYVYLEPIPPAV